jgi:hypothetical protein
MASLRRQLLPLLQQLAPNPDPSDCEEAVERIFTACRTRQSPKKALAVTLQHLGNDGVSPRVLSLLRELVQSRLAVRRRSEPARQVDPPGRWLTLEAAAALLDLHPNTLAERLRTVRYRRLYGWPIWDGHRWQLATAALDPGTAAVHLAGIPRDEPPAIQLMLPEWCERAPEASAGAESGLAYGQIPGAA